MKAFISELTALAVVVLSSICVVNTGKVTIPHEFNVGEKAVAAEVNENFSAAKTAVDENNYRINTNADAIGANADAITVNSTAIAGSSSSSESSTHVPILILKALLIWMIPFYMLHLLRK